MTKTAKKTATNEAAKNLAVAAQAAGVSRRSLRQIRAALAKKGAR